MNETLLLGWGSASKIGMAFVAATAITSGGMLAADTAQAAILTDGFTGHYADSKANGGNWDVAIIPPGGGSGVSFAPIEATLSANREISIVPLPKTSAFTFSFTTNGSIGGTPPALRTLTVLANGVEDVIFTNRFNFDSGLITVKITDPTDVIGFRYVSTVGGVTISQFTTSIPTPAMLPGLIGAGLAFWRKKDDEEISEDEEVFERA